MTRSLEVLRSLAQHCNNFFQVHCKGLGRHQRYVKRLIFFFFLKKKKKDLKKMTYLYVTGVSGGVRCQRRDLPSRAPASSPRGARWSSTPPMPCCLPLSPHFSAGWVLLRTPLQGQRARGFVRNRTPCHQKAQFQSAICQAVFGYVKPAFPQDSCL